MNFIPKDIMAYAESHTSDEGEVLSRLRRETYQKVLYPQMLSGHFQGRLLSFVSQLVAPTRILEVGTYTGYSCICLAEGLTSEGEIVTIEIDRELEDMIERYLKDAGIRDKVALKFGDAIEILPTLEGEFDLAFLDSDKKSYSACYDLIFPRLRKGGIIIADNVLWSGKVLDHKVSDKDTIALRTFNRKVMSDDRVENILLPIRDGFMVIRKR